MEAKMFKKCLAVTVILLFIGMSITPFLSCISVSSAVYVKSQNSEQKKWTLMMYDDADFLGFDCLDAFTEEAFSGENLNVLVLQDPYDSNRSTLWYIDENHMKNALEVYEETNMGNYTTLRDFINYSKTNFPAERYILLVYDHGMGWEGCCTDHNYPGQNGSSVDYLTMKEMKQGLMEAGGIDCICFTAPCSMGSLESAYELKECVDIYIGSEESSGYICWMGAIEPLCTILNTQSDISIMSLGEQIINLVKNNFKSFDYIELSRMYGGIRLLNRMKFILSLQMFTMSAIRTDKLHNVSVSIDKFAVSLTDNLNKNYFKIKIAQTLTDSFPHNLYSRIIFKSYQILMKVQFIMNRKSSLLCDIYDFADKCSILFKSNKDIYDNSQEVKQSISEAVIGNTHGFLHQRAYGLTIFFPSKLITEYSYNAYMESELDFTKYTHWDEFLESYLLN